MLVKKILADARGNNGDITFRQTGQGAALSFGLSPDRDTVGPSQDPAVQRFQWIQGQRSCDQEPTIPSSYQGEVAHGKGAPGMNDVGLK